MTKLQNLKDHYTNKWKSIIYISDGELRKYQIEMKNEEYGNVKLILEYDNSKPQYGIYYGCVMECKKDRPACPPAAITELIVT